TPGRVRVTWVFAGRDLARCRSSAREIRRLAARFGGEIELRALAVDADSGLVRSFFHLQRITPAVEFLDSATTPALRRLRWPGLYVVRGERVERVYPGVPLDDDASIRARDVEPAVASLLGRPDVESIPRLEKGGP
ncbi:MAG TPA: hypothetical protein VF771_13110, partial [Longimicrobiaceae bacterium]